MTQLILNGERACIIQLFPDYAVTESGKIYSYHRNIYLKPTLSKFGYSTVILADAGRRKTHKIHRLVAQYFLLPSSFDIVLHKDRNLLNNNYINLEWSNRKEVERRKGIRLDNKTGFKGVVVSTKTGKFIATLRESGINHHLGCFNTASEASEAYNRAVADRAFKS